MPRVYGPVIVTAIIFRRSPQSRTLDLERPSTAQKYHTGLGTPLPEALHVLLAAICTELRDNAVARAPATHAPARPPQCRCKCHTECLPWPYPSRKLTTPDNRYRDQKPRVNHVDTPCQTTALTQLTGPSLPQCIAVVRCMLIARVNVNVNVNNNYISNN